MLARLSPGLTTLLLIAVLPLSAQQVKRAFQAGDWYRVTQLSAPTLSPDAKTVAFTVTTVNEAANKRHTEVWIQSVAGGASRRMTSPGFESSAPRWSDGGKVLNFTSTRPGGRGTNWAIRMDEGGEAFQPAGGAGAPAGGRGGAAGGGGRGGQGLPGAATAGAQPADKSFTITASNGTPDSAGAGRGNGGGNPGGRGGEDGGRGAPGGGAPGGGRGAAGEGGRGGGNAAVNPLYANMPPLARPPATSITTPLDPARFDGRQFIDQTYKSNDAGFVASTGRGGGGGAGGGGRGAGRGGAATPAPIPAPAQLFIQRASAEKVALTTAKYSHRTPAVSPDGKWVIFSADPKLRNDSLVRRETDSIAKLPASRTRDEADRNASDLYILPVGACETKSAGCVPRRIDYFGTETNLQWSPDGKMISFTGRAGPMKGSRLVTVALDGGKPVDVMGAAWPYEPGNVEWLPDNTIRLTATTGGSNGIYKVDPVSRKVTPILAGRRQISGVQTDSNKSFMVYLSTDQTHPNELYTANYDGTNERKLTSFNDALNAEIAWSDAERFMYKSVDNLEIEGWLMKPFGYDASKKYPVVLYIHGGPHSAYGEGWFDEFQNLAGAGMMVLFTNPRGSSGTSNFFTNASRGDWGGKDYIDLMKAVDLIAKRPDIDSTRMGVSGGSYGGFMTAWITGHTTRFKAAQTDRMISDWTLWWGTSDAQSLTNGEFFGRPWENQAMYDTLSPIRYVKNVRTPTLLVQSEEDFRTPMPNAELWYMALRSQGVPAEFIRYPRSTHELSRSGEPWLLVDRLGRLRQWFGYWLAEGRAAATIAGNAAIVTDSVSRKRQ